MDKVGLSKGLIRYASENEIVKKEKFKLTTRMKGYIAVLIILTGVLSTMLLLRNDVEANILPLPGQLFQHDGTKIRNIYTYKIVNKTDHSFDNVSLKVINFNADIKLVGSPKIKVPKQGIVSGTLFIEIQEILLEDENIHLKIEIFDGDKMIEKTTTNFMGPRSFN
jgi:polyferredoxin